MTLVHLHLLLNHVPVVGTLFALVLFATALLLRETVSTKFALGFSAVVAVVAVAVYFTGAPAEEAVETLAGVSERAIEQHEETAVMATIAVSVFGALSLAVLVMLRARRVPRWVALAGLVGTVVLSTLMGWTANLGGQIRHTEIRGVEARMTVWQAPKVITTPASAVFQRGQGWAVFVVDHGRARLRQVEIGHRTEASVEIVSGLTPGTKVVLFPSDKIDDGVRVRSRGSAD